MAELYDEGSKEVKIVKARENQSKEVKNLPTSALFIGSPDNLLYDESVKRKFKTEFTTKLARRSFFVFANEDIVADSFNSISDMLKHERTVEDKALESRNEVAEYLTSLTTELLENNAKTISASNEVRDLFSLYKKYNEEVSKTIDNQFAIAKLTRAHLQWKALKLAGALALIEQSNTIELMHYKAAVEFVELINNDIQIFEKELVKEPYELFTSYVRTYANDGRYEVKLHNLRKLGFIPLKGQSDTHLKELVKLANSYDDCGVYKISDDTVVFTELERTSNIGLSYVPCSGTKKQRATKCNEGFQHEVIAFEDLEGMLEGDYAYSSFKFSNGVRGRDNIVGGCKWVILDIDSSEITDKEAHLLLSDINHFIVRTSDETNPNKFRVLLELDFEVDLNDIQWKLFISLIVSDLGLVADKLPKSQIYYSYKDREILKVIDGELLSTKYYLSMLPTVAETINKQPTKSSCKGMLADPLTTFDKAFNAKSGEGSRKLIWAARRARELGAGKEYTLDLVAKINSYWVSPMNEERFQNTIINQIERWSFDGMD